LKAEIIKSIQEMMDVKEEWNNLLEGSMSNTIFLTWEWAYSWAECFITEKRELFVICVYDDGDKLVGIAPWYTSKVRVGPATISQITFLGTPDTASDYLDVFTLKGREREVSNYLHDYLFGKASKLWDSMNLQDVKAESLFLLNFTQRHLSQGKYLEIGQGSFCPTVLLPKSEEEFLSQISSNRSKRFRQDLRTLKKTDTVEIKRYADDSIEEAVDRFFDLYAEKTEWDGSDIHRFMKRFLANSGTRNYLQIEFLLANANCVGGLLHMKHQNTLSLYLMAVDKEYKPRISVGNLLVGLCIGRAAENQINMYDFLKGYEEYKFYWTSYGRVSQTICIVQRRLWPVVYMLKRMAKNALKTILR
jgi:CelD/BcsL family acetyltransferase involved in cellulose biosynthesis